jgi:hypothetical protein
MRRSVLLVLFVGLAACNDPPTKDRRGYTKNILERTGPFVQGQAVTDMDRLGDPVMPETARIILRDTTVSD